MDREELNRSGLNSRSRLNFEYHLSMADCQNLGQFLKDVPNPWVKLGRISGFHGIETSSSPKLRRNLCTAKKW